MIKKLTGEIWKPVLLTGQKTLRKKYAISTMGRMASYFDNVEKDGNLLAGSLTSGYRTLNLHANGKNGTLYFHREIAKLFCKKISPKHKYVIHVNHKKQDNNPKNLKWVTLEEVIKHQQTSPKKIAYKKRQANRTEGLKLNVAKVKTIKDLIKNPKRTLTFKQIAANYKISEMTLYRIKNGNSWKGVK